KQIAAAVGQHPAVGGAQRLLRRGVKIGGKGANERAAEGHVQRRTHPFVRHIGNDQTDTAVWQRNKVVKITRHLPCRFQRHGNLPPFNFWHLRRQKRRLHFFGDGQLLRNLLVLSHHRVHF